LIIVPIYNSRVIAIGEHTVANLVALGDNTDIFDPVWEDIVNSRPIKCSATGREYAGLSRPSLVIMDGFQYPWFSIIRSTTTSSPIPILTWFVGFSAGIYPSCLPEKYGGSSHITLPEFTKEEVIRGRANPPTGEIVRINGLPEMYDWELYPQLMAGAEDLLPPGTIIKGLHNFAKYDFVHD
jgi:hypothetical protein